MREKNENIVSKTNSNKFDDDIDAFNFAKLNDMVNEKMPGI